MNAVEITVGDDGKPDGFSLDLRGYVEPSWRRRQRRSGSWAYANPWATNSSPHDHYVMSTSTCDYPSVSNGDVEGCKAARWADHLERCDPCRAADQWARIVNFEREHRAALVAIREERAALLEWARRKLARSGS